MAEAKEAKKVIVLGIDGGHPELIQRFVKEGKLPNFQKMMEQGVFKEIIEPLPTITPPNWTTITTGAWPGTHGITDFYLPHERERVAGQDASGHQHRQVPGRIHLAGRRARGQEIHPHQVGSLLAAGAQRHPDRGLRAGRGQLLRTGTGAPAHYRGTAAHRPAEAAAGHGLAEPGSAVGSAGRRGGAIALRWQRAQVYQLLVIKSKGAGYDTVLVCKDKDAAQPVATMRHGQWSEWVTDNFEMSVDQDKMAQRVAERAKLKASTAAARRTSRSAPRWSSAPARGSSPRARPRASFRFKLLNLSRDASEMELFSTQIWPISGYTQPLELGEELLRERRPLLHQPRPGCPALRVDRRAHLLRAAGLPAPVAGQGGEIPQPRPALGPALRRNALRRLYQPLLHAEFDPECASEAQIRNATSWFTRHYQSIDRMLGDLDALADEDTLVVVVSDHSGTPCPGALPGAPQGARDGRAARLQERRATASASSTGRKTKAYASRTIHVYINLKGRDPHGIVDPKDYDKVQEETITAMLDYKDPVTGLHPYSVVLLRKTRRCWGCGATVWATSSSLCGRSSTWNTAASLPTARLGELTIRSLLFMPGPNIRQGVNWSG